jgi:CRP-like cAMP-binding protein
MSHLLKLKVAPKDCILYKEGDPADYVYIIQNGEFEVFKKYVKTNIPQGEDIH